jgi:hypothetical protein
MGAADSQARYRVAAVFPLESGSVVTSVDRSPKMPHDAAPGTEPSVIQAPQAPQVFVERYLDALASHDHDAVAGLIATGGFRYESPIANIADRAAFLEYIMMTGGILRGIERRRVFVDGADVCHWLVLDTQLSERVSTRAVQWATVADGAITRIELWFDPYRWRLLFEPED